MAGVPRHRVGSVSFLSTDVKAAVEATCENAVSQTSGSHIHLLNAYSIALADSDELYRGSVEGTAVNLPDGRPVTWISRLRHDPMPLQQVRGVRFFTHTIDHGQSHGIKHFLLGSRPETLERLRTNLLARYPNAQIVGTYSPPFRPLSPAEVAAQDHMISTSGAHIVWVGLGTPKQDLEAARLSASLPVTAAAVGAAFDFVAGTVKESPEFLAHLGLEWAYRLAKEPRRLWRRYLFGNLRFIRAAVLNRKD